MGRSKEQQKLLGEIGLFAYTEYMRERRKSQRRGYTKNADRKKENERNKIYRKNNLEMIKEKQKKNRNTPEGKISRIPERWVNNGMNFGNTTPIEYLNNVFILTTHCNSCNKEFITDKPREKCLDHIHLDIPFNIRGIICHKCNSFDAWRYRLTHDSIYNMYLEQYNLYIMEIKREYTIQNHLEFD